MTVINFEIPIEITRYIHRVGRTARAGKEGVSLSICDDNEWFLIFIQAKV
jgi:superfamily II DNA/RNA helicase